jgi:hypothetical protein
MIRPLINIMIAVAEMFLSPITARSITIFEGIAETQQDQREENPQRPEQNCHAQDQHRERGGIPGNDLDLPSCWR